MATAALFDHPGYPVPPGAEVWIAAASDGAALRFALWRASVPARRGTVLLLQGRSDFIERYSETIADLLIRGFDVITFDWRGQGGSQRFTRNPRKGHLGRLVEFERDLALALAEMRARLPGPYFALAHSTGAALCLDAARHGALPVSRLVAVAPLIGLSLIRRTGFARWLMRTLYRLGFAKAFVPGGGETALSTRPFFANPLSSDPVRYRRNADLASAAPHLAIGSPTVGWLHEAFRLMARLSEPGAALAVGVPTLVIAGGNDRVVSTPAIERFAARLKTGGALVIPEARHEILMESDPIRARFWAAFDAFIPGEDGPGGSAREQGENLPVQLGAGGGDDGAAPGGAAALP